MPKITVGIPAYKPDFLAQAISSVLAQTFRDYEILISDDSRDGSIQRVVERFKDPRIRLVEGPRKGLVPNSAHVWENARGEFLKFVYDDDFILPFALAELTKYLAHDPAFTYAFSFRHIVDERGGIRSSPKSIGLDIATRLDSSAVAGFVIRNVHNIIGEPSNLLIRRSHFPDSSCLTAYHGVPVRHLIDVAFFMNAAHAGPCICVPAFHAAFREHEGQVSSRRMAPAFSAGVFEWELFARGAVQRGLLPPYVCLEAVDRIEKLYQWAGADFPELRRFHEGLPELRELLAAGEQHVLTERFLADWHWANALIADRLASTRGADHRAGPPQPS
jgi:glycosyltransferase involved in cell wall biosynthesis